MGVLPVDMMTPLPEPEKEKPKPKLNENEIFEVPKKEEPQEPQSSDSNEITPVVAPKEKKAPRGKSKDPEHLKKMREASAIRRAQRKAEKEEAERIIAEAKLIKEQELAKRMSQPRQGERSENQSFDYDKLAEAIEKRKQNSRSAQPPTQARTENAPLPKAATPPALDYKKKYEQTQIQLFEERVRADERKRISHERQTKLNKVASNNLKVPKALRKYQERASQYAENNKNNPWDSFFK